MKKGVLLALFVILVWGFYFGPDQMSAASPKGTLRMAIHFVPSRNWVDPSISDAKNSGHLCLYLFHDSLIKPMPEGIHTPCLAESWKTKDTFKVWEFKLRKGVKFHNGDEMTAEDVVFTFKRYKGANASFLHSKIKSLEAVNPYLFRVTFKEPFIDFLDYFVPGGSTIGWILPKKYIEKVGDKEYIQHPIGCGPYKYVDFKAGQKIIGEAFENFWRKTPSVKRLEFSLVKETTTRYAMIERGEVDISTLMIDVFYNKIKENKKLRVATPASSSNFFVNITNQWDPKSPWSDPRVREAASLAIDRQKIVDIHAPGAPPSGTLTWPGDELTVPRAADPYDPKRAKQLLAEAGHPNGVNGGKFFPRDGGYWPYGEMIVNFWKAVGINVETVLLDRIAFMAQRRSGKFKGYLFLDNAPQPTVSGNIAYALDPLYWQGYPDIQALWKEYNGSLDLAVRKDRLMRIQKLLYEKKAFIYVSHLSSPAAVGPRVKGNPWKIQEKFPFWIASPMEDYELQE
jgi:peptide/nickel transport system substrate-binding protein